MSATVAAPTRPNLTAAQMIEKYIALRDKVAEIKKVQTAQLAPYNLAMAALEAFILDDMNTLGADSIKAEAGTAFKATRTSASVKDWGQALEYIRRNEIWELLEARVSKTAAIAVIEERGEPVPGIAITTETTLNIRRS